jgi:hypothetical protein
MKWLGHRVVCGLEYDRRLAPIARAGAPLAPFPSSCRPEAGGDLPSAHQQLQAVTHAI